MERARGRKGRRDERKDEGRKSRNRTVTNAKLGNWTLARALRVKHSIAMVSLSRANPGPRTDGAACDQRWPVSVLANGILVCGQVPVLRAVSLRIAVGFAKDVANYSPLPQSESGNGCFPAIRAIRIQQWKSTAVNPQRPFASIGGNAGPCPYPAIPRPQAKPLSRLVKRTPRRRVPGYKVIARR